MQSSTETEAPSYVLVALHNGRSLRLRVRPETNAAFLVGIEVKKNGDEVHGKSYDERLHYVQRSAIKQTTPLEWNLTYAVLEPAEVVA
jgi:hypothetical protein